MGSAEEITGLQGLMQYLADNYPSLGVEGEAGDPEPFFEWLAEFDIPPSGELKRRFAEESLLEGGGELPPGIYCGNLESIQENHDQVDPDYLYLRAGIVFIGASDSGFLAYDLGTGEVHYGEQSAFDPDVVFEGLDIPRDDDDDDGGGSDNDEDDIPDTDDDDDDEEVEVDVEVNVPVAGPAELSEAEEEIRAAIREGVEESWDSLEDYIEFVLGELD